MPDRMWSLAESRFDEGIEAAEVYLDSGSGLALTPRDEAIAFAHERGANLVAWWPSTVDAEVPSCVVAKVSLPLRWERAPLDEPAVDERLWFDANCGGRDFLVGNGHTFVGRMAAWCPHTGVGYNVSRAGMGAMSEEARYFVAGFLAGSEPGCPEVDGETDKVDLAAWRGRPRPIPPYRVLVRPLGNLPRVRVRPPAGHHRRPVPRAPEHGLSRPGVAGAVDHAIRRGRSVQAG
ncbi:hypothetical protein [Micromonospora sp. WMMD980]|uniref:hypothetical protein n=1 Tax=Micromonospora sp. WMMD980 TaxID=3016088 RepID=UPI002415F35C|nr:hypothetical protein [Micromonospora sp. WMMD980]MDG4803325.1 hypothetical protein [Micromonospora sp. WMMD980]